MEAGQGPALSVSPSLFIMIAASPLLAKRIPVMSIDKSLRRKNSLQRARNVLTRGERIKMLQEQERWPDGRSPFGLPKVKVVKVVVKKAKKAKEEEKPAEGEVAAAAAAPPATGAGAEKKPAEKKPAEKKPAEKKSAEKKR